MSLPLISYRQGDTFAYGTVNQVTLKTSSWTGSMSLVDPRSPNIPLVSNVVVTITPVRVNAVDPSATDYIVSLYASAMTTRSWPQGPCQLRGVITLQDGAAPPGVVSTKDFVVFGRG